MAKINGMDVEKMDVINRVGLKYEKSVMKMDRQSLDCFKSLMGLNESSFGDDWTGKDSTGLRCPYYK